jgi:hypothetical protein
MDLTNEVTDEECQDYMLYEGRRFLEGKSQPVAPGPSRPRTRRVVAMEDSERSSKRFKKAGSRIHKRKKSKRKKSKRKKSKRKKSKKRKNSKCKSKGSKRSKCKRSRSIN